MSTRLSVIATWFRRRLKFVLAALAVTVTLILVVAVFPALLAGGEDSENDVRSTLLQALAGVVLLGGLYLTYRTFDLNRQGQVTDRFTRAIDQLGEVNKLDVRLGAIYALERIAWDSERDHWPTMEVLTAYVREHAPVPSAGRDLRTRRMEHRDRTSGGEPLDQPVVAADVQAILTVLGRRNLDYDALDSLLDLRRTNLAGADLAGANLDGARLAEASLERATLTSANLQGADLIEANLERAELLRANLSGASLYKANLRRAFLTEANLQGANLLQAYLVGAILGGTKLQGADLTAANLQDAFLREADLQGADLREADLQSADLADANLRSAQIDSNTQADIDLVGRGATISE